MKKNIEVILGDITEVKTEAIVNAANNTLLGGGGVDGAIHRAAGSQLLAECQTIGGCPTGEARITKGYNLQAKYVIHTVGPIWQDGSKGEPQLLRNAYRNSLLLAQDHGIESISFPNISTGVYRFPKVKAATIAIEEVQKFMQDNKLPKKVIFVCFDSENYQLYQNLLGY